MLFERKVGQAEEKRRKIILYDMNYFYAQVEELDNPSLKNIPVVVGGMPGERGGIVSTCNYMARKFGIHSGMSSTEAYYILPNLKFIKPRMNRYYEEHLKIKEIAKQFTDKHEFVSLDEGYLDVTHSELAFGDAKDIAKKIQKEILEKTGLTCSVGVGYNKMSAKLAAEMHKPMGYFVMDKRETFLEVMKDRLVKEIPGIGKKMEDKLNSMGIFTVEDLQRADIFLLKSYFKNVMTDWLKSVAFGYDNRTVGEYYKEKSIGRSVTLSKNTFNMKMIKNSLIDICKILSLELKKNEEFATIISVKMRWKDLSENNKIKKIGSGIDEPMEIYKVVLQILDKYSINQAVRGVGVSVGGFIDKTYNQLSFDHTFNSDRRKIIGKLSKGLREKFGDEIIKESIDYEKEKDNNGKIIRDMYI